MAQSTSYPYEALYRLSRDLHKHPMDVNHLMRTGISHAGEIAGLKQGCLITFNEAGEIQNAYVLNVDDQKEANTQLWQSLLDQSIVGLVYHAQRTVNIPNISEDARWPQHMRVEALPKTGSAIGIPMYQGQRVSAVMLFLHPQVNFFDAAITALLEEIAALVSDALNNALEFNTSGNNDLPYQSLFDDAVVPIILTDLDGQILRLNHKAEILLDCEAAQMLRQPIQQIHEIDQKSIGNNGLMSLQVGEEITFRSTAVTLLKDEIPVIVRARRLKFDGQDVIEWVEQNITAQMELEQLRRDLSAMVYHDLRGPLQTIMGSIHKLASVLANHENPAVLTLLQIGVQSTRQLRRMIDSLLDLQRLEEGSSILNRTPIEMRVVLADAIQLVQPLAMDAGQKLEFQLPNNLPMVELDNDMIVRVVINLVENAIKYTPQGGTIKLSSEAQNGQVIVSVQDSGPGIPKESQAQIFDKFSRVKYKDAPKGLGLGLAFCRLAVNAHGGSIWVESEPGQGSTFLFSLPITKQGAADGDSAISKLVTTA